MLRWTWSAIRAVAWAGTIHHFRVRSFLSRYFALAFRLPRLWRVAAYCLELPGGRQI
jgi:hypothetical protein